MRTDDQSAQTAGRVALADLTHPVRVPLLVARLLAGASAVLAVFPYVALVALGDELLRAYTAGAAADAGRVQFIVQVLIATFCGRLAIYVVALLISHFADVKLGASIRRRLIATIGNAPLSWFTESTSGAVRKTLQDDVTNLHVLVAHKPVDLTVAAVMPFALGTYAFILDWRLGLLALATIPLYALVYATMLRGMGARTAELDQRLARLSGTMVEYVSGINVVKAFGQVGKAHKRYATTAEDVCDYYEQWSRPMLQAASISSGIVSAAVVLCLSFLGGSMLVAAGQVTVAEVVTASLIALMLPNALETIGQSAWNYQMAGGAALRITQLLQVPTLPSAADAAVPRDATVEFDQVSLSYGDTLALRDVSLTLPQGTVTALVGPSGAGKSTLAKLVARFQDPDEGIVRIGGVDVREIDSERLYQSVAFVLQDAQLIHASVHDNIALGRPSATRRDVEQAAMRARIHNEIVALPSGYDTILGAETHLSGGQEQRIAIARALTVDAPILLLDEATAMADPESEAEIQAALTELARGRTVLVIAHRASSVTGVDQIAVVDAGRLVAVGTHDELVDQSHYARIWRHAGERLPERQ